METIDIVLGTNRPTESGYYVFRPHGPSGRNMLIHVGIANMTSNDMNAGWKAGLSTTINDKNIPVEWLLGLFSKKISII